MCRKILPNFRSISPATPISDLELKIGAIVCILFVHPLSSFVHRPFLLKQGRWVGRAVEMVVLPSRGMEPKMVAIVCISFVLYTFVHPLSSFVHQPFLFKQGRWMGGAVEMAVLPTRGMEPKMIAIDCISFVHVCTAFLDVCTRTSLPLRVTG